MNQLNNFQTKKNRKYDLEERTAKLAENTIELVKKIKITAVNSRIVGQLVGSGGSIGANYSEATESESKRDFIHKISIAKKEIKETKHWLRLLAKSNPEVKTEVKKLWQETQELLLIFSKIIHSSRKKELKIEKLKN
jgi:four helix bundle protein